MWVPAFAGTAVLGYGDGPAAGTIGGMRVLYHTTLSPFARKVRVILAEKNLEFTLKLEKVWERRPEFLALNPAGEVPVLIEPDGTVLAGTEAIVEYLDEAYREKLLIGITRSTAPRCAASPPGSTSR